MIKQNILLNSSRINISDILLKQIIDESDDSIYCVDSNYCYIFFNMKHFNFMKTNFDVEIELGKCLFEYTSNEDYRVSAKRNIDRCLAGEMFYYERSQEGAGNDQTYFTIQFKPLKDESGVIIGAIIFSSNTTLLKKTIIQLEETKEKYKHVFEHSTNGISLTKPDGTMEVNKAFCDMLGYSQEEMVGKNLQDISYPEDIQESLIAINTLMNRKVDNIRIEKRYLHRNGSIVWVDLSTTLQRNNEGTPLYFITTVTNITQQKLVQEALKKSEARFRVTLDSMLEGCMIISYDWKYLYVNEGAAKHGIKKREELLGYSMLDVYPGVELTEIFARYNECMTKRTPQQFESSFTFIDGTVHWFELRVQPIPEGIFVFSIDITERKHTELEIRKMNRVYAVITQINQMIIRAKDSNELFEEACRIAVTYGNFKMAWVGLLSNDEQTIKPVTWFGVEDGYLTKIKIITLNDMPEGQGPTGTAMREGKYSFCNDIANDPRMAPWRDEALNRGYHSSIALPIIAYGKPIGVLTIYTGEPFFFNDDEIRLLEEVTDDITYALEKIYAESQHKQAEEALIENENRFRLVSECSLAGIYILKEERLTYVNPALAEMFGYNTDELIGQNLMLIVHQDDRELVTHNIHRINSGERDIMHFDFRGLCKNGSLTFIEILGTSVTLQGHKAIMGNVLDITERKQAEELLSRERNRLRILIDTLPDRIYVKDAECRFVLNNLAHQHALNIENNEDIIGKTDFDFRPPQLAEQYHDDDMEVLQSGLPLINREEPTELVSGEQGWLLTTKVPIKDESGVIVGLLGISRDITERKRIEKEYHELEQTFIETQKLESIGTLAGGIAHDFNNILSIILGHSSLLKYVTRSPEAVHESLDVIENAVKRGSELVKQILTFARKSETVFGTLSINTLIKEHVKMLNETFPKIISISLELDDNFPVIIGDPTKIYQVLMNLCVNARDAMPEGGRLIIKTEIINKASIMKRFSGLSAEQYLCLSITDKGLGMDDVTLKRIFDPFFTTKEKGKGTGLGLAVVYGIMKSHDGYIDVKSQPGSGTTFYLYFPIPVEEVNTKKLLHDQDEKIPGGTETILFVEDEVGLRDMMKTFLELNGYKVLLAIDGEDALLKYSEHKNKIDIIFSDMGLPKITGQQMFSILKEHYPNLKCIFASGFVEPNLKTELLKSGIKDILLKPYTTTDLLKSLRKVLDQ